MRELSLSLDSRLARPDLPMPTLTGKLSVGSSAPLSSVRPPYHQEWKLTSRGLRTVPDVRKQRLVWRRFLAADDRRRVRTEYRSQDSIARHPSRDRIYRSCNLVSVVHRHGHPDPSTSFGIYGRPLAYRNVRGNDSLQVQSGVVCAHHCESRLEQSCWCGILLMVSSHKLLAR